MVKQNILSFLFLFILQFGWGQTETKLKIIEAKDIPIDTTQQISKVVDVSNSIQQNDTIVIESKTAKVLTINEADIHQIHLLQDDPSLAKTDSLWMDLVKQSDLYDVSSLRITDIPTKTIVVDDLSTELLKERLAAIDAKTPFHVTYNPDLERLIKTYLKTRQKALANLLAKSKYYFPLFEEKLDQYDIPLEMKYLAIVESALRPKARSRVGATGLWQFMYPTGRQYGLDVSSYVDERQDPMLATEAACKYLADLYTIFNDWDLALAAYNSGPGNVNKAIRRSGGNKNYWNIRTFLPRETASYVPIFYATLYLFEYADAHNLVATSEFNLHHFEVDSIQVKKQLTFEQIQTTTGINESLLEFLNPAYKLNIIPHIKDKNYGLVLPSEYIGLFVQNESQIYAFAEGEEAKREKPLPEYIEMQQRIRYRVRSGDYLGLIAQKYGVSVSRIKQWNHLRNNDLRIGQRLTIYPRRLPVVKNKTAKVTPQQKTKKALPKGAYITYIVKDGDSLWSISQKYQNVSVSQIKDWNNIWGNKLKIGVKLKIYKG
ncbi:MAG: LysM peptidoglycan-binding domain-containing protein [Bacteroidales bacterium]|nr:LysM peptidoglycan-binding domain-containing protein [Bacteroidales bacterium]